jgi:hypothetical protein
LLKNKTELENTINNSPFFTFVGENMDAARAAAKAKLVSNLWEYCKDRPLYPGKKGGDTYRKYGEELWKAMETSINNFVPGKGDTFLHYFNGYCARFLKKEIIRSRDEMTNTGMLKVSDIQFIKKIQRCKEDIEKTGKKLSDEQKLDWIAKILGCTKEKIVEGLKKNTVLNLVSVYRDKDYSEADGPSLFDLLVDTNSSFHKAIPTPAEAFEIEEQRKNNKYILDAMEYVFSQKTKDNQKLLLKRILAFEYAEAVAPDGAYSFIDHDILSRLKKGEKLTRREIAKAFYPEKTTANAEATAKMVLERFMDKVRNCLNETTEFKNYKRMNSFC